MQCARGPSCNSGTKKPKEFRLHYMGLLNIGGEKDLDEIKREILNKLYNDKNSSFDMKQLLNLDPTSSSVLIPLCIFDPSPYYISFFLFYCLKQ